MACRWHSAIFILASVLGFCQAALPLGGKNWYLLVAGSNGYYNYRHQADICHAYQLLHENGVPDEQIIVMMADDIANNPDNPTPGIIINKPKGRNVYPGVLKDYTNQTLTPENFLNILAGNKKEMEGIGSGRVIESGPNDYVFVNFVDHGGAGILMFGETVLTADDFVNTIQTMAAKGQFAKMFIYIEACHAGSMFDNLLPDDINVIVMTAADPYENSFACYFDNSRNTYLADVFSSRWLHFSETESLSAVSLHHQFEKVRTYTNTSHVEEYGNLDMGETHLSDVLGFHMKRHLPQRFNSGLSSQPPPITDSISNADVPVDILMRRIKSSTTDERKEKLRHELHSLLKMRDDVDKVLNKLVRYLAGDNEERRAELNDNIYILGSENMPCYKQLLNKFSEKCFNVAKNPYLRKHLPKLINMCDSKWVTTSNALDAISAVCSKKLHQDASIM